MKTTFMPVRSYLPAWLAVCGLLGLAGCHAVDYYSPSLQAPIPAEMMPPVEGNMVSQESYIVEPPDVLMIEMLKLVPLPPYRVDIFDVLQIRVIGTLLDQPIDGFFLVEAEGIVTLGPAYGTVHVAGMTNEEASAAITRKLQAVLSKPEVSVQLARTAGTAPVTGEYMVQMDGMVNLRQYGMVHVAGKTVMEIRRDLIKHLSQYFNSPEVAVEVRQVNSKVFYVITEGAGLGDNVRRFNATGNDTVLDALAAVNGLSQVSSAKMWVARPAPTELGCVQILPVDYAGITQGAATATNYQLMPGDRVYVQADGMIAFNSFLTKMTAPIERLLGTASLGTSFTRGAQTLGRQYNQNRFGN
jgi:polysaccharide biosynthesis/export protein